jgi:Cof subfamily protein (haloacid dehalogenase superfamily)
VRLLALDLDGTLLDPAGTVTPRSVEALRAAHEAGVTIVIASGRPPFLAAGAVEALAGIVTHGVMANGSLICTLPDGAALRAIHFPIELAVGAVRLLRSLDPEYGFALATANGFASEAGFFERMGSASELPVSEDALEVAVGVDVARRLMVWHRTITTYDLLDRLPSLLGSELSVGHLGADAAEILPCGTDKASGLRWLCDHLDVDRADVVAIGDEYNDHDMLRWAGHGVAMGNADPVTKQLADSITLTNAEDGVAVAVERLLADRHP